MSARHERPMRAYRTRAQFLLEELDDPDPAVSRLAARWFGWLPRFASKPDAWRTLSRADVSYGDALDVIARDEGAENWRDFLANGSPPEHVEFCKQLAAARASDDARVARELTGYAIGHAHRWSDLRVAQRNEPWDDGPEYDMPSEVASSGGTWLPDITGTVDGVPHVLVVLRAFGLGRSDTVHRLRCFARHVADVNGVLQVFTDGDGEHSVRRFLRQHRIPAEVVVWGGMYHHEIEDAIAADWWRDVDD